MNLSSNMKRILVFSDPHLQIAKVEHILKYENYDTIVCLGDWFDSFYYDNISHLDATCVFLKKWLFNSNFYTCLGNHDIHYLYDNQHVRGGGFEKYKSNFITNCLGDILPEVKKKFLWYVWIDNFFCSHAGLNVYHFKPRMNINKQSVSNWLNKEIKEAEMQLISGNKHWLYGAGKARGGNQKFGGILWQDFRNEFEPIEGLNQIVGHTYHSAVIKHVHQYDDSTSENYCIDCTLNQYLIIENGKLIVKPYSSL